MSVTDRKKCRTCNKYLTEKNQYPNDKKWYICKKCAKKYFRERRAKEYKTQKIIMHNLKINGCALCGYNDCDEALDFHHVNPWSKKFQINMANLYHSNLDIVNEINKCILLCKNCHTNLHATTRKNPLKRQGYIRELNWRK